MLNNKGINKLQGSMNKTSSNKLIPENSSLICLIISLILIFPLTVFSWDGYDYENGNYIEINDSDIPALAPGAIIEIYDNEDNNHHAVQIISISKTLDETNIEAYDQDTDEYRTFEMEVSKVINNRP
ncbi:MAG: DUF5334 family protein [Smithellaceae bacterium]